MTGRIKRIKLKPSRDHYQLLTYYAIIASFHAAGLALFLYYGHRLGAVYAGAGGLAYAFGLRHAFDADHISAIDDTTRFLMQRGKKSQGAGFFFSLGHSTVVIVLAIAIASAAGAVQHAIPTLQNVGATVGASVSGTFLLIIAWLDFAILLGVIDIWRKTKQGQYTPEELDALMSQRGFISRIMGRGWRNSLRSAWQMYPIGLLFGLGFDTASEVGLLALTTVAAVSGHAPIGAVLALPLLFTAGMALMDTTDGVFMTKAYGWAFTKPIRKVYYNLVTVSLGIFVAVFVGAIEYLQVFSSHVHWHGRFWSWLNNLNFELLGYFIVATFVLCWGGSILYYKLRRIDERYGEPPHSSQAPA